MILSETPVDERKGTAKYKCLKCNGWTKRKTNNSREKYENKERFCPRCDEPPKVEINKLTGEVAAPRIKYV